MFPGSNIHLALRRPTIASRIQFADVVENVLQDAEGANEIRRDLMSEHTVFMMREMTLETWRRLGWEVTWEYVDEEEDEERDQVEERSVDTVEDHDAEVADEDFENDKEYDDEQASRDSE